MIREEEQCSHTAPAYIDLGNIDKTSLLYGTTAILGSSVE